MAGSMVLKADRKEGLGVADIMCLYLLIYGPETRTYKYQSRMTLRLHVQSDGLDDELILCNEKGSRRGRASKV